MSNIKYSDVLLNSKFAPYDNNYCVQSDRTSIQELGQDINELYAGYDGIPGNKSTATGAIKTNGIDIASLFIKPNSEFASAIQFTYEPTGEIYDGYTGPFSLNIYYTTGPIQFNYSDDNFPSPVTPITITKGTTGTIGYEYGSEFPYNWTATAGNAYVGATGSFLIPPLVIP